MDEYEKKYQDEGTNTGAVLEAHARMALVRALIEMAMASRDPEEAKAYARQSAAEAETYATRPR